MTFQFFFTPTVKLKPPGVRGILFSAWGAQHYLYGDITASLARANITGLPEVRVTQYIYSCGAVLSPLSYTPVSFTSERVPACVATRRDAFFMHVVKTCQITNTQRRALSNRPRATDIAFAVVTAKVVARIKCVLRSWI